MSSGVPLGRTSSNYWIPPASSAPPDQYAALQQITRSSNTGSIDSASEAMSNFEQDASRRASVSPSQPSRFPNERLPPIPRLEQPGEPYAAVRKVSSHAIGPNYRGGKVFNPVHAPLPPPPPKPVGSGAARNRKREPQRTGTFARQEKAMMKGSMPKLPSWAPQNQTPISLDSDDQSQSPATAARAKAGGTTSARTSNYYFPVVDADVSSDAEENVADDEIAGVGDRHSSSHNDSGPKIKRKHRLRLGRRESSSQLRTLKPKRRKQVADDSVEFGGPRKVRRRGLVMMTAPWLTSCISFCSARG